jgi:PAS domain S-box-containing protein
LTPGSPGNSLTGLHFRLLLLVLVGLLPTLTLLVYAAVQGQPALSVSSLLAAIVGGLLAATWTGRKMVLAPIRRLLQQVNSLASEPVSRCAAAQDVDGPQRADEDLRINEAQFHLLTDAMPQIVWRTQADGRYTYVNRQGANYTGLSMADNTDHNWTRLVHPDDLARVTECWARALASGQTYEIEYRLRRADGVYRWMLVRAVALCDASGERTAWLGTFTDIEELKQATTLLQNDLSMLHIAGKVARLGGWTIDLPDRTLTWSDENCLIHDVEPGYLPKLEKGIAYFLPEHRAQVMACLQACEQHGKAYEFVLPKMTAKGRKIWVRSIGEAVRDASGKIIRLQGAFQDITEMHTAQAHLHLLEAAVARLNDIVFITEAEPFEGKARRVVFVNDACERRTGYSREEVIGNSASVFWGKYTQHAELERMRTNLMKGQATRAEIVLYSKAGKAMWLEIDVSPITDEAGKSNYWVSVARDVTLRKQQHKKILDLNGELEERVASRTAQLALANKELESFIQSLSHDLRSPLNTVDGFSQMLLKTEADKVSEKGKHYLNRIRAGVKQMGDLIEGLLTLAHLSREELRLEPVDLSVMARRIEAEMRERTPARQVAVQIQDGLNASGDPRLLSAVLQNLLANAWKFTARQTQAHLEFGSVLGDDGELRFFVKDNGVGFDMAFSHKLFGTFERLHSSADFPGTGIGLATVKRIVERHGGRVWAESQVNQGATFYFTLSPMRGTGMLSLSGSQVPDPG